MKEYKEKSSFRYLDIIGNVYEGLLADLIIFIIVFFRVDANGSVDNPLWVDIYALFMIILVSLAYGVRGRRHNQWSKTIWIDKDKQIVEVEYFKGAFLEYNFKRIPFSNLEIKFGWVRVGSKPSNREICSISIMDKGELVTTCSYFDKWTNGGFDELVSEFSTIKEEYCVKEPDSL